MFGSDFELRFSAEYHTAGRGGSEIDWLLFCSVGTFDVQLYVSIRPISPNDCVTSGQLSRFDQLFKFIGRIDVKNINGLTAGEWWL